MRRLVLLVVVVMFAAAGCVRVPAHRRGRLAAPAMQAPVWQEVATGNEHVYTVREGTGGANGAGGGGCGCN
jgi:hypothetical protein